MREVGARDSQLSCLDVSCFLPIFMVFLDGAMLNMRSCFVRKENTESFSLGVSIQIARRVYV